MAYRGIIGNTDGTDSNDQDTDSLEDALSEPSKEAMATMPHRNKLTRPASAGAAAATGASHVNNSIALHPPMATKVSKIIKMRHNQPATNKCNCKCDQTQCEQPKQTLLWFGIYLFWFFFATCSHTRRTPCRNKKFTHTHTHVRTQSSSNTRV